jgi:hypothetical protein
LESVVVILKFFISPFRRGNNKNLVMELVECNKMGIMKIDLNGNRWWEVKIIDLAVSLN